MIYFALDKNGKTLYKATTIEEVDAYAEQDENVSMIAYQEEPGHPVYNYEKID